MKKTVNLMFICMFLIATLVMVGCSSDDDPEPNQDQVAYDAASIKNGGMLYDKFWRGDAGFDQNDANLATISANGDFFRCKQCHGWDGLGNNGAYISRAPKTTRPNVSSEELIEVQQNDEPIEIFNEIKGIGMVRRDISYDLTTYDPTTNNAEGDKMPDFSQILTDAQIWDLVKFIKEGMIDVSQLYDATVTGTYPTGSWSITNVGKNGDATKGDAFYATNCASCHDADGTKLALDHAEYYVGDFIRKKGNEAQQKVQYGIENEMTAFYPVTIDEMKDLYKALSNSTMYPGL